MNKLKLKKEYEDISNSTIENMANEFGLPSSLVNYIIHLGYDTNEKIQKYLNPNRDMFYDAFLFPDMKAICARINKAIQNNEHILIFGDYDADGIGATAILYKYLTNLNVNVDYFLPSRYTDGYGLTKESVDKVKEQFNPDLIITVDCGIACYKEVEYIKSLGMDVIITDHHEPQEIMPDCLVIDCKIPNQPYPFKCLCGAGMALKVVYALSNYETARKYFTICAISTIADIVELIDENRFIVIEGLKSFEKDCPKGLKRLFEQLKINSIPTSTDVSYKVAPKLNATGRMGDATVALKLYLESNDGEINNLCKQIIEMNEQRQAICERIFANAQELICENDCINDSIIILKKDDWEIGVLGIVCSKLIESYNKSVILFGKDKKSDNYVGSARAVEGVNIFDAVSQYKHLLVASGGHEMAMGLTIDGQNFNEFRECLIEHLALKSKRQYSDFMYDIAFSQKTMNIEFLESLNKLEPFGVANPKPKFIAKVKNIQSYPMAKHNEHLLVKFMNFNGVMFNKANYIYTLNAKANKALFCSPFIETYAKKKQVKIFIDKVYCDEIGYFNNDISRGNHFKQYVYAVSSSSDRKVNYITKEQLENLGEFSTLYISFYADIDKEVKKKLNFDLVDYVYLSHKKEINTLLIAPNNFDDFNAFENIVLLDNLLDVNHLNYLKFKYPNANIYVLKQDKETCISVSTEKAVFANFYTILLSIDEKFFDEINMYRKHFEKIGFSYPQFVFCLYVFDELGIVIIHKEKDFYITINDKIKTSLNNSMLYSKILKRQVEND